MFTSLLKYMIKNTDEQLQRSRSGRVLSPGALVPVELGHITLPMWVCSPIWKLLEHPTIGILWRIPYIHTQLLTPFPAHLPSVEDGAWS